MKHTTLHKCRECEPDYVDIIFEYEPIDTMYGMNILGLTVSDIKALKDGKGLYYSDGEYATVIYMRK